MTVAQTPFDHRCIQFAAIETSNQEVVGTASVHNSQTPFDHQCT